MLKVERVFNAVTVNYIANDSKVRPYLGGDGKSFTDLSKFTDQPHCWVFECGDENGIGACFIGVPMTNELYEAHTMSLQYFRGKNCILAARICLDIVFEQTDCQKVFGRTPVNNLSANRFNRLVGFDLEGRLTGSLKFNNQMIDENIWGLRRDQWVLIR